MTPITLYHPVRPLAVNGGNVFGANPKDYAKFGWKGHNGIDYFAAHGTPLYAPCDGMAHYVSDAHGGDGIYILAKGNDGIFRNVILWHMCAKGDIQYPFSIPTDGSSVQVRVGQPLGYTDNSGAPYESSGDHLHFGLQPCRADGSALYPDNGYGGCVDPAPLFAPTFAEDYPAESEIVSKSAQLIGILSRESPQPADIPFLQAALAKVATFLKSLIQ